MKEEVAERPGCPDGANVERRRCLRNVNGRPGLITSKGQAFSSPTRSRSGLSRGLRDKGDRGKVEKGFTDSSSTEPRKMGDDTKP